MKKCEACSEPREKKLLARIAELERDNRTLAEQLHTVSEGFKASRQREAEMEAQVRTAGAEALEKMDKRFSAKAAESERGTAWWSYFREAAGECAAEARRLRDGGGA